VILDLGQPRLGDGPHHPRARDPQRKTAAAAGVVGTGKAVLFQGVALGPQAAADQQRGRLQHQTGRTLAPRPERVERGRARQGGVEQRPVGGADVDHHRQRPGLCQPHQRLPEIKRGGLVEAGENQPGLLGLQRVDVHGLPCVGAESV